MGRHGRGWDVWGASNWGRATQTCRGQNHLSGKCRDMPPRTAGSGMGAPGPEHPSKSPVNQQVSAASGAESGAVEAACPGMSAWLASCPKQLSEQQRAAVLGIVQGASRDLARARNRRATRSTARRAIDPTLEYIPPRCVALRGSEAAWGKGWTRRTRPQRRRSKA